MVERTLGNVWNNTHADTQQQVATSPPCEAIFLEITPLNPLINKLSRRWSWFCAVWMWCRATANSWLYYWTLSWSGNWYPPKDASDWFSATGWGRTIHHHLSRCKTIVSLTSGWGCDAKYTQYVQVLISGTCIYINTAAYRCKRAVKPFLVT